MLLTVLIKCYFIYKDAFENTFLQTKQKFKLLLSRLVCFSESTRAAFASLSFLGSRNYSLL